MGGKRIDEAADGLLIFNGRLKVVDRDKLNEAIGLIASEKRKMTSRGDDWDELGLAIWHLERVMFPENKNTLPLKAKKPVKV